MQSKLFTMFAMVLAATVALAEESSIPPETLTFTRIDSRLSYLPIAIGHNQPGTDGQGIMIKDVIQTAQLQTNDELYVYNHTTGDYNLYKLTLEQETVDLGGGETTNFAYKVWQPQKAIVIDAEGNPSERTSMGVDASLDNGYGLWLHRKGDGVNSVVWATGSEATNIVSMVAPGKRGLIGLPGWSDAIDLTNLSAFPKSCVFVIGDLLTIPADDAADDLVYRYDGTQWVNVKTGMSGGVIAQGQAFWYSRVATATDAIVFKW